MAAVFRRLTAADAEALSEVLLADPVSYSHYFRPFDFDAASLHDRLARAVNDHYFGVFVRGSDGEELAGFYMLRGFDEGYAIPMYGVFIGAKHSGIGLGRLTLQHAIAFCGSNDIAELRLKVHPENLRAKRLYESEGFKPVGEDLGNGNVVLGYKLSR